MNNGVPRILSHVQMTEISLYLNSLLSEITYLDACSFGKTSDFQSCLARLVKDVNYVKSILNKAKIYLPLRSVP